MYRWLNKLIGLLGNNTLLVLSYFLGDFPSTKHLLYEICYLSKIPERYMNLLIHDLEDTLGNLQLDVVHDRWLQDGAPAHKSRADRQYLSEPNFQENLASRT